MPQRFLRPGITTSDAWNLCSWKAQSLYIRLITLVDDYGRYDGRIAIIHGHCFPLRIDIKPQETAELVSELSKNGLVCLYEIDGKDFLQMLKWHERTRGESKYPKPIEGQILRNNAESCDPQAKDASIASAISHKPAPLPPKGQQLDDEWLAELKSKCAGVNVDSELVKMDRWLLANPARKKTRKFIVNWMNRCDKEMPKAINPRRIPAPVLTREERMKAYEGTNSPYDPFSSEETAEIKAATEL